jgi:hypothetical protein
MPCKKNLGNKNGDPFKKLRWVVVGCEPQQMVTYWEEPIIFELKSE